MLSRQRSCGVGAEPLDNTGTKHYDDAVMTVAPSDRDLRW
jgi:hypothetical protein